MGCRRSGNKPFNFPRPLALHVFRCYTTLKTKPLIYISIASLVRDIGKRSKPRSDASDQGLHCLLAEISI